MQLSQQSWGEFAVLVVTGTTVFTTSAVLVSDFKGALSRYVNHLGRYASGRGPAFFGRQYASPRSIRLGIRLAAVMGLVLGFCVLALELLAFVGGDVK